MSILRRFPLITALLSMSVLLAGCSPAVENSRYDEGRHHKLTVLHTNDNNGQFWRNDKNEWGMAARKTLIDSIREEVENEGGHVLLLSGGNINKGVPESDLQSGIPDILGMNLIGYDAMVVGSHEFDIPPNILKMQQDLSTFPILAANVFDSETGQPGFDSFKTFNFNGLSVGVVGITTPDTLRTGHPENTKGIEFTAPVRVARSAVDLLREDVDVLIALAHLGHFETNSGSLSSPGDLRLADKVEGYDLIVGGHSQNALYEPVQRNGSWIVQAGCRGQYVGRADFELRNGKLTMTHYELIPVNHEGDEKLWREAPEMLELLAPYKLDGELRLQQSIGVTDERLQGEADEVRTSHTNLGNLIASAQQEMARADFAVVNAGSIKASLPEGSITYQDILSVQPDSNMIGLIEMKGFEVEKYLRKIFMIPKGDSGFAQFSGVTFRLSEKEGLKIKIRNTDLRQKANYRMAINTALAAGEDGYPTLIDHPGFINLNRTDADALWSFIENNTPIQAANYDIDPMIDQFAR
ncbi:hypothetical protein GZ77_23700 [Endozoicomonas montiporae]|uniref:5'-nucleotidase n=2 Tax=Endozoicomonas montiporae TaxID=1027273 RepID=A0A081N0V9_9GAMM|nr:5'-nucleotidase C-terminal domain-containing protein [Endozoicomonas montiporae]AMO54565.1 UDP-sugar diphosphatase [Endozoicomonas montiporae CL-33]KEQ12082.1 hypothetical protein GZ77_23700 [Endozoicomonas montiporae]